MTTTLSATATIRLRLGCLAAIVLICASLGTAYRARAATYTWNSAAISTSWNTASNWGGTVPGSGDVGRFAGASYSASASTPTLSAIANLGGIWDTGSGSITIGGASALSLYGTNVAANANTGIELDAGAGSMTITAPLVLKNTQQWINNSVNPLTISGNISGSGSLTKVGSGALSLAGSNSLGGSLTADGGTLSLVSGSLVLTSASAGNETIGLNGTASFAQLSGTNSLGSSGTLNLGYNPASSGSYNLSGGWLSANYDVVGFSGMATFNQSGGTHAIVNDSDLAYNPGSSSTYRLSGGSLSANNENIGVSGTATMTQTGGTNNVAGTLNLGKFGAYTLSGGFLSAPTITGTSSSVLNVSGGTLFCGNMPVPLVFSSSSTGATPVFLLSSVGAEVGAASGSGGIIYANGNGGGNGTIFYSQPNTYSGPTTISPGISLNVSNSNALLNTTLIMNNPDSTHSLNLSSGTLFNVGGLSGTGSFAIPFGTSVVVGGNNQNTTFSGSINTNGFDNDGSLVKAGTGTLDLTGNSNWTGGFILDPGTVGFNSDLALGDLSNTITFNGSSTLQALTSVVFSLNRNVTIGAGAIATFDTQGYTLSIGSSIAGAGSLTKTGSGALVLYGADSYTGTTSVASGKLVLDFNQANQASTTTTNIVNNGADSSPLVLSGATLAVLGAPGTSNSQQFNGLFINSGVSAIALTATTSNPLLLSLGGITRAAEGMIDFSLSGSPSSTNGITTTTHGANGILGAYATVAGINWAALGAGGGNISAYSAYTGGNLGLLSSSAALNVSPTGSQTAVTAADTFNTLNLSGTVSVSMSGPGALTLLDGGLLGNTSGTISGGTLEGSSGSAGTGELIVISPRNLTIGSVIADNGGTTALTKAGSATLILAGSNTYSGVTTVDAGTLQIGNGASGSLASHAVIDNSALVFDLAGVTTYSGAISGVGTLTLDAPGKLVLSGTNTYSGGTIVTGGVLELANPAAIANGASLIVGGKALVDFGSANPSAQPAGSFNAALPAPEPDARTLLCAALAILAATRYTRRYASAARLEASGSSCQASYSITYPASKAVGRIAYLPDRLATCPLRPSRSEAPRLDKRSKRKDEVDQTEP